MAGRRRGFWALLDQAFFLFGGLSALWLAYLLLVEGIRPGWQNLLLLVFWVLVAYLALPRIHRILTRIYLPDYFIGRTRTSDGLLGDPVNLALRGTAERIHVAMHRAGWVRAEDLTFASGRRIVAATLSRRSYAAAPVSPLHLFGRRQDFAYQQEVEGSPSKRHHVRFWRCPEGWLLPGGFRVDWLAAGTYDRSVGLSLFTLQVTHKIEMDIDVERDHIVATLTDGNPSVRVESIENFSTGYHARNGGGDLMRTDGDLPVLDLTGVDATPGPVPGPEAKGRAHRPSQIVFGSTVSWTRGLLYLGLAAVMGLAGPSSGEPVVLVVAALVLMAGTADLVLGTGVFLGWAWARVLAQAASVAGIVAGFSSRIRGEEFTITANLIPIALSVLVLLALSSDAARRYRGRSAG